MVYDLQNLLIVLKTKYINIANETVTQILHTFMN